MKNIFLVFFVLDFFTTAIGQVNLQTGSAVFDLPMFNWQDDKSSLKSTISLNYNSGTGLKVTEVASNVGQGWHLLTGGVITRVQAGEPDDQLPREGEFYDIDKYPAGYLYNPIDPGLGCPKEMVYFPIFDHQNQLYKQHNSMAADREKDYFSFQFNDRSGMFILGRNNGDQGIQLGDSKLKIWYDRNPTLAAQQYSRTTITAFYIQDENGLIYTFSQLGLTKVLRIHPSTAGPNPTATTQSDYADGGIYYETAFDEIPLASNPYIISSWYLSQVKDPLTNRTINFSYSMRNINNKDGDDIRSCSSNATIPKYVIVTHKVSNTYTPALRSIQYPDGHNVIINYDLGKPRVDLIGDYPVKSVDISYNSRAVSSYLFNTTYFIFNGYGFPNDADKDNARLCLKSIVKLGVDLKQDEPPYIFDYYTGDGGAGDFVPPPFYHFRDIRGYYDGGKVNDLLNHQTTASIPFIIPSFYNLTYAQYKALCYIQDASASPPSTNTDPIVYAKNGLIKSITYPMGGKMTYDYQPNDLVYRTIIPVSPGGIHVSTVTRTDGGYSNNDSKPLLTTYKYTDPSGTKSSQWGVEDAYAGIAASYHYVPGGQHHTIFNGCQFDYTFTGIQSREEFQDIVNENMSPIQVAVQAVKFASYAYDIYTLISAGNPVGLIMDVVDIIINVITECNDDYSQNGDNYMGTNYNAYGRNPFPTQFSRVEVIQGPGGTGAQGKTVYEFTSEADYPFWDSYSFPGGGVELAFETANPFSMRQRAAFWTYGLLKKKTIYDGTGNMVKQTENVYNWNNAKRSAGPDQSCNCQVDRSVSISSPDWMNLSNTQNLTYTSSSITYGYPADMPYTDAYQLHVDQYSFYTGRVEVSDTYERTFRQGDPSRFLETVTHYDYNPNNYQVSKSTVVQSNGDKNIKEMYYSSDYSAPGVLQTLKANNMVDMPVATYNSVIKNNTSTPAYMGANVTQFTTLANGDIKPSVLFSGRSAQPVIGFNFDPSSPLNYPNLTGTKYLGYDAVGNLIKVRDEAGRVMTNIHDYNDKYIVATIINADPDIDPVAYTSFETPNTTGWVINGGPTLSTNAFTGSNSFILNNKIPGVITSITSNITINKPYVLSFWASPFSFITVGGNPPLRKTGPTYNGFTYYEYAVPAGTTAFTLRGSGRIDELRLYPEGARMKTVTYDPLIGKTAECDENNRVTYYEYDDLARLHCIRDANKNIIKMFEYNSKQSFFIGNSNPVDFSGQVFARMSQQNFANNAAGDPVADIIVSFYSDAACTKPVYLNNISVNYYYTVACTLQGAGNRTSSILSVMVSGLNAVLMQAAPLQQISNWQDENSQLHQDICTFTYVLSPGGYLVK